MTTTELGKIIKERRTILHLHQKDLAELSEVSLRTIIQIENGVGNPSLETINRLAKVVGMEVQIKLMIK